MPYAAAPQFDLTRFAGQWHGPAKTYFEPGKLADESAWDALIRELVPGNFYLLEYHSKPAPDSKIGALRGTLLFGYERDRQRFTASWVDTFHMSTAAMVSHGDATSHGFNVTGSYKAPTGPDWGWRTEFRLITDSEFQLTMYNICPDGQVDLAVDVAFRRA